ncbi:VWA domain-containing protein [Vampirovibrio sp.]|uniref:vWA domain-containing protein n=1 Tax=Vampirovibrio sp. TaxID=2717857 RepID=UPI003592F6AC
MENQDDSDPLPSAGARVTLQVKQSETRHRQHKAGLYGLLLVLAAGFCVSALGELFNASAQAQQAPITGNVQQNRQGASQQGGPENVMIILDASYSMSEPIEQRGEDKMMAAKRTVLEVLRNIAPSTRVGLRVYGNSANQFTACKATSLLVPLGENNRNLIASKMIALKPTGATPISYAVLRSLHEDFNAVNGNQSIILISDGIETCGEDPCDVAVKMQQMGVHVKINVIGLGLQDYAAVKQLRCVALATKGQFYTANTAAELANSLNQALAVETKVQGTIIQNPSAVQPAQPQSQAPAQAFPTAPTRQVLYPETELPAAVPIQLNKR